MKRADPDRTQSYILPDDVRVVRQSEIVSMLEADCSIATIARHCQVTPQTIHYKLRQMGYQYSRTKGWQKSPD